MKYLQVTGHFLLVWTFYASLFHIFCLNNCLVDGFGQTPISLNHIIFVRQEGSLNLNPKKIKRHSGKSTVFTRMSESSAEGERSPHSTSNFSEIQATNVDQEPSKKGPNEEDRRFPSEQLTSQRWLGLAVLGLVPLLWGTYTPTVKFLYNFLEAPPPGPIFNLLSYSVSFASLCFTSLARQTAAKVKEPDIKDKISKRNLLTAGLELGGWLFLGSSVQVVGLGMTTASRAGFLVQLTTVLVPLMEAGFLRSPLPLRLWFACAVATIGVALLAFEGASASGGSNQLLGDGLVSLSAIFYSLHVIRLGYYLKKGVTALPLAVAKSGAELSYSLIVVSSAVALGALGPDIQRFISGLDIGSQGMVSAQVVALAAVVLWNGAMTTAFTMWAQSFGQQYVRPSEANLIYSLQPLWSSFFAVTFLQEQFTSQGIAGSALLITALILAAQSSSMSNPTEEEQQNKKEK